MEIQFLNNEAIDKKAWDECLLRSPGFELYMQASYLDTVFPQWKALVVGNYEAIFPVFEKKNFQWKILRHPLFTGPCTISGQNPEAVTKLKKHLPDFLKSYHYIDFNILNDLPDLNPAFQKTIRKYQQLQIPDEGFNLDTGLKRNLKKATQAGIENLCNLKTYEYIQSIKEHLLAQHKALNKKGVRLLTKIVDQKDSLGGECVGIKNGKDETQAGQFFLKGQNKIYVILSYSTQEGRKNSALHALQIKLINQHLLPGGILHFGGSNMDRIAEYNHNYGAEDITYWRITRKRFPFNYL